MTIVEFINWSFVIIIVGTLGIVMLGLALRIFIGLVPKPDKKESK